MLIIYIAIVLINILPCIYAPAPNIEHCQNNIDNNSSNNRYHTKNFLKPSIIGTDITNNNTNSNNLRCNIPIILIKSSNDIIDILPDYPVIYKYSYKRNIDIKRLLQRKYLLDNYGDITISLTSSNTYSHGLKKLTLNDYIHNIVDNNNDSNDNHSNETYYFFGNNYNGIWEDIASKYESNICKNCDKAGAVTLGIGGKNSGVSFHYHGPGFSESIIGRKRWFLYPPDKAYPEINPNITVADWVKNYYQEWTLLPDSYECVIESNELLFFPPNWIHATLNLDSYNAFVSLFLDTGLMENS
jgi:hypothetical protein